MRTMPFRTYMVTVAIGMLFACVLLVDFFTPAENVSVCFAYVIPIFVSLFEARSRAIFYAGMANVLSLAEPSVQPPHDVSIVVEMGNRVIAALTQWLAAALVLLQQRRLVDARDQVESQRRFVDVLSQDIGPSR